MIKNIDHDHHDYYINTMYLTDRHVRADTVPMP